MLHRFGLGGLTALIIVSFSALLYAGGRPGNARAPIALEIGTLDFATSSTPECAALARADAELLRSCTVTVPFGRTFPRQPTVTAAVGGMVIGSTGMIEQPIDVLVIDVTRGAATVRITAGARVSLQQVRIVWTAVSHS